MFVDILLCFIRNQQTILVSIKIRYSKLGLPGQWVRERERDSYSNLQSKWEKIEFDRKE
jgi:hypothetical protein